MRCIYSIITICIVAYIAFLSFLLHFSTAILSLDHVQAHVSLAFFFSIYFVIVVLVVVSLILCCFDFARYNTYVHSAFLYDGIQIIPDIWFYLDAKYYKKSLAL